MENDLVCNYRKCRKRLTKFAWVTSCSHIFCDEDGAREFSNSSISHICPACESNLTGKYDVIKTDLQPTDQYKSMVLAGQRPEVIMEVCSRAMAFWTYQSHQERVYQEYVASRAKEKCTQMDQYYQQVVSRAQAEMAALKQQITNVKKDLDDNKLRYNEVSEKLMERNRQYQRLQAMYDSLRRRSITPRTFNGEGTGGDHQGSAGVNRYDIPLGVQGLEYAHQQSASAKSLFDTAMNPSRLEGSFSLHQQSLESQSALRNTCPAAPSGQRNQTGTPNDRRRFSLDLNTPAGIAQQVAHAQIM